MEQIDFHGIKLEDALKKVDLIINDIRKKNASVSYTFVTGRGEIQKALKEMLTKEYQLEPIIPMANNGVIEVTIE